MCAVTVVHGADGVRVKVEGELDLSNIDQLTKALDQAAGELTVVDMAEVTFLDSTGVTALLRARDVVAGLRIVTPSRPVARLLEIVGLYEMLCCDQEPLPASSDPR
jgi:anti-sigma B factor antagonist